MLEDNTPGIHTWQLSDEFFCLPVISGCCRTKLGLESQYYTELIKLLRIVSPFTNLNLEIPEILRERLRVMIESCKGVCR